MSDYENVREIYKQLYGGEKWFLEREKRFEKKTKIEIENDKKLFYALAEPEKFSKYFALGGVGEQGDSRNC